jgi:hypothetical protein
MNQDMRYILQYETSFASVERISNFRLQMEQTYRRFSNSRRTRFIEAFLSVILNHWKITKGTADRKKV